MIVVSAVMWRSFSLISSCFIKSSTDTESSVSASPAISSIFSISWFGSILGNRRGADFKLVIGDVPRHHFFEDSSDVRNDRDHSRVLDAGRAKNAQRTNRGTAADPVRSRYQRAVLQRGCSVLASDHNLNLA